MHVHGAQETHGVQCSGAESPSQLGQGLVVAGKGLQLGDWSWWHVVRCSRVAMQNRLARSAAGEEGDCARACYRQDQLSAMPGLHRDSTGAVLLLQGLCLHVGITCLASMRATRNSSPGATSRAPAADDRKNAYRRDSRVPSPLRQAASVSPLLAGCTAEGM